MGFGGGITIVKGSCWVGRAAQKVPFLLYNLQRDLFHSRWFCSISYTGCWMDLLGSQTCSCKMVNHLDSKTCIQIILLKSKYSKPCQSALPEGFHFVTGVSSQCMAILHANGHS